ncbi:acyl-CoA dehydrogenase family protein [Sneathiella chinensis]|uniref:Acyl-CoA dehydrogenase n=1 Tax=Sneathiella chinensis TaxID=349750 RepID=A0ABQ5U3R1_9PROT|nr:acyl-CoA dehydrogenase family protein [Sneathiella chinensis]GLQ06827.1 acyl-CoA dehydrogenase [Sneathiella chinensis]
MSISVSARAEELRARVEAFMNEHVYAAEEAYKAHTETADDRWSIPPIIEELKAKAKAEGLWNLFLAEFNDYGAGLSNLEYAPLAEIMGRSPIGAEAFNCSAPDTGNMEVLARYGTEEQKQKWLIPLLEGEIRSAFAMTEPAVASSDATNIQCSIKRDGDDYVINGRKWWISGAPDPRCKIMIVMGKTNPDAPRHQQQSQILVPKDTPGVTILRPMKVFGSDDAPHGHAEVLFENVRVPTSNLIGQEGEGFAIAQGRLGPGRIHHCMRLIGCAQRAIELMCQRVESRVAFGKKLSEQGSIREDIAKSICEVEQARLLTLKAADKMDKGSYKDAKDIIAMIKIVAPNMAQTVIDRAMQAHGAMGLSQDTFLAEAFAYARTVRLADGPDQVHMNSLGKQIIQRYAG